MCEVDMFFELRHKFGMTYDNAITIIKEQKNKNNLKTLEEKIDEFFLIDDLIDFFYQD